MGDETYVISRDQLLTLLGLWRQLQRIEKEALSLMETIDTVNEGIAGADLPALLEESREGVVVPA